MLCGVQAREGRQARQAVWVVLGGGRAAHSRHSTQELIELTSSMHMYRYVRSVDTHVGAAAVVGEFREGEQVALAGREQQALHARVPGRAEREGRGRSGGRCGQHGRRGQQRERVGCLERNEWSAGYGAVAAWQHAMSAAAAAAAACA